MKKLLEKFAATKFYAFVVKVVKAFSKFLKYVFAAHISYLFLAVLIWLLTSKLWGILALAWGVILLVSEIKEQKAEKLKV